MSPSSTRRIKVVQKPQSRFPRFDGRGSAASMLFTLSLGWTSACTEDPSFDLSWKITRDADDLAQPDKVQDFPSRKLCAETGIQQVRLTVYSSNGLEVTGRDYPCHPNAFSKEKPAGGPHLKPGDYRLEFQGLRRSGQVFCERNSDPRNSDCEDYEYFSLEDEQCEPCVARNESAVTIEEGKRPVVEAVALLAPLQCDDGIDNDRDGRVDSLDPACLLDPSGPESGDSNYTIFRLSTNFLDIPSATCAGLGISHFRVKVDDHIDELVPCSKNLPTLSYPLDNGSYVAEITGVQGSSQSEPEKATPVTTTKDLSFESGEYVEQTLEFSHDDFLEEIVSPLEFTLRYFDPAAPEQTRLCEASRNQPNLLTLDSVSLYLRDENGQLVPADTLNFTDATENEDGSVSLPCPSAALRSAELPWGRYTLEAKVFSQDTVCYANETGNEGSMTQAFALAPGVVNPVLIPRVFENERIPPEACYDCNDDSDCGPCVDCCIDHVCDYE